MSPADTEQFAQWLQEETLTLLLEALQQPTQMEIQNGRFQSAPNNAITFC